MKALLFGNVLKEISQSLFKENIQVLLIEIFKVNSVTAPETIT